MPKESINQRTPEFPPLDKEAFKEWVFLLMSQQKLEDDFESKYLPHENEGEKLLRESEMHKYRTAISRLGLELDNKYDHIYHPSIKFISFLKSLNSNDFNPEMVKFLTGDYFGNFAHDVEDQVFDQEYQAEEEIEIKEKRYTPDLLNKLSLAYFEMSKKISDLNISKKFLFKSKMLEDDAEMLESGLYCAHMDFRYAGLRYPIDKIWENNLFPSYHLEETIQKINWTAYLHSWDIAIEKIQYYWNDKSESREVLVIPAIDQALFLIGASTKYIKGIIPQTPGIQRVVDTLQDKADLLNRIVSFRDDYDEGGEPVEV